MQAVKQKKARFLADTMYQHHQSFFQNNTLCNASNK